MFSTTTIFEGECGLLKVITSPYQLITDRSKAVVFLWSSLLLILNSIDAGCEHYFSKVNIELPPFWIELVTCPIVCPLTNLYICNLVTHQFCSPAVINQFNAKPGTLRKLHTKHWFVLSSSMQHLFGIPIVKLRLDRWRRYRGQLLGGPAEDGETPVASATCLTILSGHPWRPAGSSLP